MALHQRRSEGHRLREGGRATLGLDVARPCVGVRGRTAVELHASTRAGGGPGDGLQLRTHPGHTFRVYRGDELVRSFTVTAPRGGKEAFHLR